MVDETIPPDPPPNIGILPTVNLTSQLSNPPPGNQPFSYNVKNPKKIMNDPSMEPPKDTTPSSPPSLKTTTGMNIPDTPKRNNLTPSKVPQDTQDYMTIEPKTPTNSAKSPPAEDTPMTIAENTSPTSARTNHPTFAPSLNTSTYAPIPRRLQRPNGGRGRGGGMGLYRQNRTSPATTPPIPPPTKQPPHQNQSEPTFSSDRVLRTEMKLIARYTNDPSTQEFHINQEFNALAMLLLRVDPDMLIYSRDKQSFFQTDQTLPKANEVNRFVQMETSMRYTYMALQIKTSRKLQQLKFDPNLYGYLAMKKIFLESSHFNSLAETKIGFITMKNPNATNPVQFSQELRNYMESILTMFDEDKQNKNNNTSNTNLQPHTIQDVPPFRIQRNKNVITSLPRDNNDKTPIYKTDAMEIWCEVKHARKLQIHFRTAFSLQKPPTYLGQFIPIGKSYAKLQVTEMVLHNKFLKQSTTIHVTGISPKVLYSGSSTYSNTLREKIDLKTPLFTSIDQGVDKNSPGRWIFTTMHYHQSIEYLENTLLPKYHQVLQGTEMPISEKLKYSTPTILYHKTPTMTPAERKNSYAKVLLTRRLEENWDHDEDTLLQEAQGLSTTQKPKQWSTPPKIIWDTSPTTLTSSTPAVTQLNEIEQPVPTNTERANQQEIDQHLKQIVEQYETKLRTYETQISNHDKQIKEITSRLIRQEANSREQLHQHQIAISNRCDALQQHLETKMDKWEATTDEHNTHIMKKFSHQTIKFEHLEKGLLGLTHAINQLQSSITQPSLRQDKKAFTVETIREARLKPPKLGPKTTPTRSPPPKRNRTNQQRASSPPSGRDSNRFDAFLDEDLTDDDTSQLTPTPMHPDEGSEATSSQQHD